MIVANSLVRRGLRFDDGTNSVATPSLVPCDRAKIERKDDSIELDVGGGRLRCSCLSMNGWSDWQIEVLSPAEIASIAVEWQLAYDVTDRVRLDGIEIARGTPLVHESTSHEVLFGTRRLRRLPTRQPDSFDGLLQIACDPGLEVWIVRSTVAPRLADDADLAARIAFRRNERVSPRLGPAATRDANEIVEAPTGTVFRIGLSEA